MPSKAGFMQISESTPLVVSEPDRLGLDPADVPASQGPWRHARVVRKHKTRGFKFRACSGLAASRLRNLIQAVLNSDAVSSSCRMLMASMRSARHLMHPPCEHILPAVRSGRTEGTTSQLPAPGPFRSAMKAGRAVRACELGHVPVPRGLFRSIARY